jgi:hypothetical protein
MRCAAVSGSLLQSWQGPLFGLPRRMRRSVVHTRFRRQPCKSVAFRGSPIIPNRWDNNPLLLLLDQLYLTISLSTFGFEEFMSHDNTRKQDLMDLLGEYVLRIQQQTPNCEAFESRRQTDSTFNETD